MAELMEQGREYYRNHKSDSATQMKLDFIVLRIHASP